MRPKGESSEENNRMLCRQLFVGLIPGSWTHENLCKHICEYLHIPLDKAEQEIHFDRKISNKDSGTKKKIAFLRFAKPMIHKKALDKATFKGSPVVLNIKESNQEDLKRKLFIGKLSDHVTVDDVEKLISKISPEAAKYIENNFPQVPEKSEGKPKIAFIQFENHHAAYCVKEALKRVLQHPRPDVISLLEHMCRPGAKLRDVVESVSYYKRSKNDTLFGPNASGSVRSLNTNKSNMEFWYQESKTSVTIHIRKDHAIRSVTIPAKDIKKKPHHLIPARGATIEYREMVPGFSEMSLHSSSSFARHFNTSSLYSAPGPARQSNTGGSRLRNSVSAQNHQSMLQQSHTSFHSLHHPF
ncbi:Oidioi.mRNA.OKI2018_I69.XSR.g13468.t1.cds [Oikopleura dioica]|uniref:Oidioi.mRNA.OKI2018_I69.XSR.g13468.t1.cds n=1 Tax=Oikopleura dioica TaxID=34765 RepID=A0ABN7SBN5_OIKDI|nr:Oidioi.mRNA.OKI2018_I69.XSR.g13468.t1.cds [Oikopleura dioica]